MAGPLRAERRPPGSWTMTLTHGTPLKSCSGAVKHWTRLQGPGPGPASTARSCLQLSRPSVLCTTAERGISEELDPEHLHVRSSHKTGTAPGLCLRQPAIRGPLSPRGKGTAATSARFYGAIPPAFHQAGTNLMFSPDTAREQQAGVPGASGFHQASISLRLHPAHVRPHPSPSRSCGSSPHPLACCRKKKATALFALRTTRLAYR